LWQPYLPEFAADIPRIAMLQEVLQPYLKSPQLFSCPADIGFAVTDLTNVPLDAFPSSFEKYGTSYYYRTTLAGCRKTDASLEFPSQNWVLVDGVGYWHGTLLPLEPRYNVLLADGHVKNLTWAQWRATGGRQLNENALPFGGCH
jgi:prepilin-type processing-associated H-X9-DG protein